MDYVWTVETETKESCGDSSADMSLHKTRNGAKDEWENIKQSAIKDFEERGIEYNAETYESQEYVEFRIYKTNHYYENYYEIIIRKINIKD